MAKHTYLDALPPYLGGKRRLVPLIFAVIAEWLPRASWPSSTFLDPCCGGGSVALTAKAQGFRVIASDGAGLGGVVARALVENSTARLVPGHLAGLGVDPSVVPDARLQPFVPGVFTAAQAEWLVRADLQAEASQEPVRSLMRLVIACLAVRCHPMGMLTGTDARAAGSGDFDRVSPRRLAHYLRVPEAFTPASVARLVTRVNGGVFPGSGRADHGDALEVIRKTAADVLYLDPPYAGTTGYGATYAAVDALFGTPAPPAPPALEALLEGAHGIRWLVLSYGGPRVTLDGLVARVAAFRVVRTAIAVPYPHLRSLARKEHADASREYLIVAERPTHAGRA